MNAEDLEQLDSWSAVPGEHRLAAAVEASLHGEDFKERKAELANHLGYPRPNAVELWFKHVAIIPIRHLPKIAAFTGIPLSVLVTYWVATYAADDDEEDVISKAIAPRITDDEYELIETARAIFHEQASERSGP